jgi:carbon storage regulator
MHIFSLQVGEGVRIGDEATASVVGIKGGQVRVGITARSEIPIHREELVGRCENDGGQKSNQPAPEIHVGLERPEHGPQDPG